MYAHRRPRRPGRGSAPGMLAARRASPPCSRLRARRRYSAPCGTALTLFRDHAAANTGGNTAANSNSKLTTTGRWGQHASKCCYVLAAGRNSKLAAGAHRRQRVPRLFPPAAQQTCGEHRWRAAPLIPFHGSERAPCIAIAAHTTQRLSTSQP